LTVLEVLELGRGDHWIKVCSLVVDESSGALFLGGTHHGGVPLAQRLAPMFNSSGAFMLHSSPWLDLEHDISLGAPPVEEGKKGCPLAVHAKNGKPHNMGYVVVISLLTVLQCQIELPQALSLLLFPPQRVYIYSKLDCIVEEAVTTTYVNHFLKR
jgi:hypothetical protein